MRRSDFSSGIRRPSLPPISVPESGPEEISWGKVKQCPAAPALTTPRPRSDIGRRVGAYTRPGSGCLHKGSLTFGAAVRLRLPSHTPSRVKLRLFISDQTPYRAVAFGSWLPPTGPTGDLHPQSLYHAQRTLVASSSHLPSSTSVPGSAQLPLGSASSPDGLRSTRKPRWKFRPDGKPP